MDNPDFITETIDFLCSRVNIIKTAIGPIDKKLVE